MKPEAKPNAIHLKDYRPPSHWIDEVRMRIDLHEDRATVVNAMKMRRNSDPKAEDGPLALDGESLRVLSVKIDGRALGAGEYEIRGDKMIVPNAGDAFELEITTECEPQKNLAFEGLYRTSGMFCTQCEAEGFRRIAYYLDRPDVMAKFRVAIEADEARYPVLLSNGNLVSKRSLGGGRHEAIWEDPFKKPAYLFAMVAGDLGCVRDEFVRRSGRPARLEIYCEKGLESRCLHAMDSLKKAMKWDEDVFGLEYDLDVYMIVVANDFNMGAMENKGLNVFNSSYVLARPETATDSDYDGIMAVVGHEYFHNWTGNRVTCRDWFQLSLKEGLTVFRDQEFSGDMSSRAVNRIEDVIRLRTAQFAEDAGPMAHPVRPQSYISINNFYTATVYEKGAEVIRMIRAIIGPHAFRKGMDKYFELFDGQAVTTEDFVRAMEIASGQDLTQFKNWYDFAGTPRVKAKIARAPGGRLSLTLSQSCPPTPGQPSKPAFHVPFAFGWVGSDGKDAELKLERGGDATAGAGRAGDGASTSILHLREAEQTFAFSGAPEEGAPSFLRGFSAPVRLEYDYQDADLAFLMANDSDSFARWEAAQTLSAREMKRLIEDARAGRTLAPRADVVAPFAKLASEAAAALESKREFDADFASLMLLLPSEQVVAQQLTEVDPEAVHAAREAFRLAIARTARRDLERAYRALYAMPFDGKGGGEGAGARSLKSRCLDYLGALQDPECVSLALRQLQEARCMTDELGALAALVKQEGPERERALETFYEKWKAEPLVVNKWLALQATSPARDALERVRSLANSPAFDKTSPNKVYSLLGGFASHNLPRFHAIDGSGYRFIVDQILDVEARNPQVAARLMNAFNQWRRFDPARQALMKAEISRVLAKPGLSSEIFEIASKALSPAI